MTRFWGRRQILWVFGSHHKDFSFPSRRRGDPLVGLKEGCDDLEENIPVLTLPGSSYDSLGESIHQLELTLPQRPDAMPGLVTSRPCAVSWTSPSLSAEEHHILW